MHRAPVRSESFSDAQFPTLIGQPGQTQPLSALFPFGCRTELMRHLERVDEVFARIRAQPLEPQVDRACGSPHPRIPGVFAIPLSGRRGGVALVDTDDYPLVAGYHWLNHGGYAYTRYAHYGQLVCQAMHRIVAMAGASSLVDHINHDKLDNRLSNLRVCTHAENVRNRRAPPNRLGVQGVTTTKAKSRPFRAHVTLNYQMHYRDFATLEEAIAWRTGKSQELHGEFAYNPATDVRLHEGQPA